MCTPLPTVLSLSLSLPFGVSLAKSVVTVLARSAGCTSVRSRQVNSRHELSLARAPRDSRASSTSGAAVQRQRGGLLHDGEEARASAGGGVAPVDPPFRHRRSARRISRDAGVVRAYISPRGNESEREGDGRCEPREERRGADPRWTEPTASSTAVRKAARPRSILPRLSPVLRFSFVVCFLSFFLLFFLFYCTPASTQCTEATRRADSGMRRCNRGGFAPPRNGLSPRTRDDLYRRFQNYARDKDAGALEPRRDSIVLNDAVGAARI